MRRAFLAAAGIIAALVLQLTVVNRLPWPGAGTPDLVLLMVVALGLCGSPEAGAVTGFLAGLGLDIAPPASYLIGEYALVFCLVGYGCGRLRALRGDSAWRSAALAVLAAAAGEMLVAGFGKLVGDPQVSWSAIRQVLPVAIAYDAVLSPVVFYLVLRVLSRAAALGPVNQLAGPQLSRSRSPAQARAASALPGGAGLLGGAGWLAGPLGSRGTARGGGPKRVPRLRDAAARTGDGWIGGSAARRPAAQRPGGSRPPRLRPGSGQAGSSAAIPLRRELPRRPVNLRLGQARRRDGVLGPGRGSSGPAYGRRGGSGPAGSAFRGAGAGPRGSAFRGAGSGPRGSAFRGAGAGPRGSAFRGAGAGPRGSALRGAGSGPRGSAFRGAAGSGPRASAFRGAAASGPRGSAFRGPGPRGSAFRSRGSGPGGSAWRGAGHGPPGKAFRRSVAGPAFSRGRPGSARSLLVGAGAPARAPRFRPHGRLSGGSASGSLSRRSLPGRSVTLRLRAPRRRDGVLGSGLARGAQRRRGLTSRAVRLRLGGTRRGDGMVAGLAPPGRRFGRRSRLAVPRFRRQSTGSAALAGRRTTLRSGKQARFRSGRHSLLTAWSRRRLGSRSGGWRIGSSRTGGLP